jgi:hypothetical protein
MYTLQKLSLPSNLQAIFMVKIRINFADPADDATMAPDGASSLRTHLSPCPPSRLRGTKPLIRTVVDTESDMPLHLRATSSQGLLQKDAPSRKSGVVRRHRPIRETQIWGFHQSNTISSRHLLQNNVLGRRAPPLFDPGAPDLGFPQSSLSRTTITP